MGDSFLKTSCRSDFSKWGNCDTLAAARAAKQQGCYTIAICKVPGSRITREVDGVIITKSGQEVGVAATKTFLTQMQALMRWGAHLAFNSRVLDHPNSNLKSRDQETTSKIMWC